MPTDAQQIATIKSQTLARIAEITAQPKPTYQIDGQLVAWGDYLSQLQRIVDWCNEKLSGEVPFEIRSQGFTVLMTSMFDPTSDLANVADGTEPVTLLRRGKSAGGSGERIAHALRRAITTGEAAIVNQGNVHKVVASGGQCTAADLVWHLPAAELAEPPRLGDVIVDGGSGRWTILAVKRTTLGARWRCETRNVSIAFGLDDTITVLKMTGMTDGYGMPIWRTWKTGVRARIQPEATKIVSGTDTPHTTASYRIFVEEDLELDHTCSIRGPDGALYTITGTSGGSRIGEVQVIDAEISSSGQ